MQVHSNETRVVIEVTMVLVGFPVLGLIASVILWARAKREVNAEKRQYQRLGFGAACFAFTVPLSADCIRRPAELLSHLIAGCLPLLCIAGVLASLTAAVLLAINARGVQRIAGPLLCLLGFVYCGLTIFAYSGGGADY